PAAALEPPPAAAPSAPPASAEEAWALSLDAAPGPLDSPLDAPGADHALELASLPSPGRAARANQVHEPPPLEFDSDAQPTGPSLELDVRPRESAPRYDPIPAGEHWRAPGANTLVKA